MAAKKKMGCGSVLLIILGVIVAVAIIIPNTNTYKYHKAQELLEEGRYHQAAEQFEELEEYKDAEELLRQALYQEARQMIQYREYLEAAALLETMADYEDSRQLILSCYYELGREALQDEKYPEAISYFQQSGGYEDANAQLDETYYAYGHHLFLGGLYDQAQAQFANIQQMPQDALPHFISLEDARAFFDEQSSNLTEEIRCYIGQMPTTDQDDLWEIMCNYIPFRSASVDYNQPQKLLDVTALYYPGERILYALRTGDDTVLSEEEKEAKAVALELVAEAENSDTMKTQLYLYNWLCEHIQYDSPDMNVDHDSYMKLRQLTCVGALVDGKANCQGYTDAFYLLGNMAGFDVRRISGTGEGEDHSWNGILLDGKTYIVDVTFGDADEAGKSAKTYSWMNCAFDPEVYQIDGGIETVPGLVTEDDLSQTYYAYKESTFEKLGDASYYLLRQRKKHGKGWAYAVVLDRLVTNKELEKSLKNNYRKAGLSAFRCSYFMEYYNGNTYIAIKWK